MHEKCVLHLLSLILHKTKTYLIIITSKLDYITTKVLFSLNFDLENSLMQSVLWDLNKKFLKINKNNIIHQVSLIQHTT